MVEGIKRSSRRVSYDYNVAARSAEAFQIVGSRLLVDLRKTIPEGSAKAVPAEIGSAVCAATNLALSLELFMKATYVIDGRTPPKGHNLLALFDGLPDDVKAEVTRIYDSLLREIPRPVEASLTIVVGDQESPEWEEVLEAPMDIESVLRSSRDAFVDWRYLFEVSIPSKQKWQWHRFEHLGLRLVCEAFATHLKGSS